MLPPCSSSGCPSAATASPLAPPGPLLPAATPSTAPGEAALLACAARGLRRSVRIVLTTVAARLKCCTSFLPPCRLPPVLPLLPLRWW